METGDKIDWEALFRGYNEHMVCRKWGSTYMEAHQSFWDDRGGRDRYFTTDHAGDEIKREFLGPPANQRVLSDSPPEQSSELTQPNLPYSVEVSNAFSRTVFMDASVNEFGVKQILLSYTNLAGHECEHCIASLDKIGRLELAGGSGLPQPYILTLTVRK